MRSPPPGRGEPPEAEDEILVAMLVRGPVLREVLARDSGLPRPCAEAALADLTRRGLLVAPGPAGGRVQLSVTGREAAIAAVEREGARLAARLSPRYAAFARLDRDVKDAITRWQVRLLGGVPVANDHRDGAYDRAVLAELRALCDAAVAWLVPLAALRTRYLRYGERLSSGAARAAAGEGEWVCGLGVDSVHSVWWQLHGELLLLLGRSRGASPG